MATTVNIPYILHGVLDSILDDDTQREICGVFAEMCEPYVPMRTGKLNESGLHGVQPDGVEYNVPYATSQYLGVNNVHNLEHHPLATAFWDEAMMRDHGDEFTDKVAEILLRRAHELYG